MTLRSMIAKITWITLASLPRFSFAVAAQGPQDPAQILQKTRDTYVALKSYSDTGVVVLEYGTSTEDRHTFTTYFNRVPRGFLLDFKKQGGVRYVIWGDPEAFHTWWQTTGQQYDYPNPNNLGAFTGSTYQTGGAAMKIPTLIYGKSALNAKIFDIADPVFEGAEDVDERRCYRVTGRASDVYAATGREVNVHKVTIWIDAESFLVRKVVEESKPLPGQRSRVTTIFQPLANPALDAGRLKFAPPEQE